MSPRSPAKVPANASQLSRAERCPGPSSSRYAWLISPDENFRFVTRAPYTRAIGLTRGSRAGEQPSAHQPIPRRRISPGRTAGPGHSSDRAAWHAAAALPRERRRNSAVLGHLDDLDRLSGPGARRRRWRCRPGWRRRRGARRGVVHRRTGYVAYPGAAGGARPRTPPGYLRRRRWPTIAPRTPPPPKPGR